MTGVQTCALPISMIRAGFCFHSADACGDHRRNLSREINTGTGLSVQHESSQGTSARPSANGIMGGPSLLDPWDLSSGNRAVFEAEVQNLEGVPIQLCVCRPSYCSANQLYHHDISLFVGETVQRGDRTLCPGLNVIFQ